MANHPEWALKHKTKGTEIRKINNGYYLYEITSRWDKEKKRPVKVTKGMVGRITESGLIKSKYRRLAESVGHITIKEFGAFHWVWQQNQDIAQVLQKHFPAWWKELWVAAYLRLLHQSPLKHFDLHYQTSFISEELKQVRLGDKAITAWLREVGKQRSQIVSFLQHFSVGHDLILIDATHVISLSEGVSDSHLGYNSQHHFDPQVNLLFIYGADKKMPIYYRLVPGNIREVKALKLTIQESGLSQAIVVTDKGFYSRPNRQSLEDEQLRYIIPLRRNSALIDYRATQSADKKGFDGYFRFEDRVIWYHQQNDIWLFQDEELKNMEQKDYLQRVENQRESYSMEKFYAKHHEFGTIAVICNVSALPAQKIFEYLKSRVEIEIMFDAYKNILAADRTYMHGNIEMETWTFINHLALLFYYRIYQTLLEKDLLKKFAPKDFLLYLSHIKKVKIQNEWKNAEFPNKTKTFIKKSEINIPIV